MKTDTDYDNKVDMYSLGIISFEMCHQPIKGMERQKILEKLRLPIIDMPSDILTEEMVVFNEIVLTVFTYHNNYNTTIFITL